MNSISSQWAFISTEDLFSSYLPSEMEEYFRRKTEEDISEDELKERLSELIKYFVLSHKTPGDIFFSDEIDHLWHLWILQTAQYMELCAKLPGGQFIHHSSHQYPSSPPEPISQQIERALSFFASYVGNFGFFTERTIQYWPMALHIQAAYQHSLDAFNNFLMAHFRAGASDGSA